MPTSRTARLIAIEFVRGEPIDEYCSKRSLRRGKSVKLRFSSRTRSPPAHAMLVVHSDIKPANVLVTCDGTPQLIDFGISTALRDGRPTRPRPRAWPGCSRRACSAGAAHRRPRHGGDGRVRSRRPGLPAAHGSTAHADAVGAIAYVVRSLIATWGSRAAPQPKRDQPGADPCIARRSGRDPRQGARAEPAGATVAIDLRTDLQRHLSTAIAARPASPVYRAAKFVRRNAPCRLLVGPASREPRRRRPVRASKPIARNRQR